MPQEQKEQAKKFKEYKPGFLHIDVTYLPKLDGQKYYLFVAIDRATRLLYYKVYENNRTPCEAVKSWFDIEPQNFKISPDEFYATLLNGMVQRGET